MGNPRRARSNRIRMQLPHRRCCSEGTTGFPLVIAVFRLLPRALPALPLSIPSPVARWMQPRSEHHALLFVGGVQPRHRIGRPVSLESYAKSEGTKPERVLE